MRARLKGINSKIKRLADGSTKTYWYAWKSGPRLPGKPGDPEFVAAYAEAHKARIEKRPGTLLSVLNGFQASGDWNALAARTQRDYVRLIKVIEGDLGDFPLAALDDKRTRGVFLEWRDKRAEASPRQADYGWQVLARILSWAKGRGIINTNPCEKGGRLYRGTRRDIVWSAEDEAMLLAGCPPHLRLPFLLGLWTGQRQGDLLDLHWSHYDGKAIRLRQSKTGARVVIPVGTPLKLALDAEPVKEGHILRNSRGLPWTSDGFGSSWKKACKNLGISGVTFMDLRGTAVTRLALAGATLPEISTFTGHGMSAVREILEAHYLHRDPALGEAALTKLERRTKIPD